MWMSRHGCGMLTSVHTQGGTAVWTAVVVGFVFEEPPYKFPQWPF